MVCKLAGKCKIIKSLAPKFNKAKIVLKAKSPEILIVGGGLAIVGGFVWSNIVTSKIDKKMEPATKKIEAVHIQRETLSEGEYPVAEYRKDITLAHAGRIGTGVKAYVGPVLLTSAGVAAMFGSYNILKKRNLAVVAAYTALDEAFKDYRKRVIDDVGEEKDRHYRYGTEIQKEKVSYVDENGNKKTKTVKNEVVDGNNLSGYSKFFKEGNLYFNEHAHMYNENFLKSAMQYLNDKLRAEGYVFLNDVYEYLGIERTLAGQSVGWILDNPKGDGFINFGAMSIYESCEGGYGDHPRPILLDFNVDGVIDGILIKKEREAIGG